MKRFLTCAILIASAACAFGQAGPGMRQSKYVKGGEYVCVTNAYILVTNLEGRLTGPGGVITNGIPAMIVSATGSLANATWVSQQITAATNAVTSMLTNEAALRAAHTNRTDNPHSVTAPQIGALTNEQDLAALRLYNYGSPDIVESPAEWFVFDGVGTITAFNWAAGRTNVVIPWAISGVPVTAIGENAFAEKSIISLNAPQTVTSIEASAFDDCGSLTSVSLPQAQTVGDYAFNYCISLTSVSLPQAQTVGEGAFNSCTSLTSVSLPQAQTVGDGAFYLCIPLTSVYFDNDAPTIGAGIFSGITPNQVTNYVTNPQATGWGATLGDMPVVRLPLYADAITLNGDTITEWPVGGGETSIIAPLYDSGTNVTVTSTQSVYSVAVTGAGPVGIDWSGLALDGTGRAEVTLRLNVTEWGGTNVTFTPALTFDRTPEILVTGVWEFAASTIDGVTTRVRQTWPECCSGMWAQIPFRASGDAGAFIPINILTASSATGEVWSVKHDTSAHSILRYSFAVLPSGLTSVDVYTRRVISGVGYTSYEQYGNRTITSRNLLVAHPPATTHTGIWQSDITRLSIGEVPSGNLQVLFVASRPMNANERAAYEAGWRP